MASRHLSAAPLGYPMTPTNPQGTVFQDRSEAATITVVSAPPRTVTDAHPTASGFVRLTETRSTLTPTVTGPQTLSSNTWTEDLQPTWTTKTYETMRRDVSSLFPGANIVSVGQPQPLQSQSVYHHQARPSISTTYTSNYTPARGTSTYSPSPIQYASQSIASTHAAYIPPPQTYVSGSKSYIPSIHARNGTLGARSGYVPVTTAPSMTNLTASYRPTTCL